MYSNNPLMRPTLQHPPIVRYTSQPPNEVASGLGSIQGPMSPVSPVKSAQVSTSAFRSPRQVSTTASTGAVSERRKDDRERDIVFPNNDDSDITAMYMQSLKRGEDWSFENFKTIVNWLNLASLYLVLLDYSIEYYTQVINSVTLWGIFVSTLTTTISISQFAVNESHDPVLSFSLKVFFTVMSFITAGLTAAIKVLRAKEHLEMAIYAQNKWMKFATELSSQLQLPIQIRTNAIKTIITYKDVFKELFTLKVTIPNSVKRHVAYILEMDAQNEQTISKLASGEVSVVSDYTDMGDTYSDNGISFSRTSSVVDPMAMESPTCGDGPGCSCLRPSCILCWCCKTKQWDEPRVMSPTSQIPQRQNSMILTTKQINHIFDASRLNLYFIFKDLLSNEIRAFETYMRELGTLNEQQQILFTITPSRIFMHIVEPVNTPPSNHPSHTTILRPATPPPLPHREPHPMMEIVRGFLEESEQRMYKELQGAILQLQKEYQEQQNESRSYIDTVVAKLGQMVSKSPVLESTSELIKSVLEPSKRSDDESESRPNHEQDDIIEEIHRQNALNESMAANTNISS